MKQCKELPTDRFAIYFEEENDSQPRKRQAQLPTTVYTMPAGEQQACSRLLAEAIYSSGVPFSFVRKLLPLVLCSTL